MNNFKAISNQLRHDYLTQTAAKGEILGLVGADYYLAGARFLKSIGKRFSAIRHPSTAALPTVIIPHRWL